MTYSNGGYHGDGALFTYAQASWMNIQFAHRMLEARKQGLEKFTIGVVKNDSPMQRTLFWPEFSGSLLSSSAALCADDAGGAGSAGNVGPTGGGRLRFRGRFVK